MSRFDLTDLSRKVEQQDKGIPPLERWNPDFCGDIDIRIARDGTWYHEGTPIGRKALVKLFSHILWRENDRYFLKTPVEKLAIQVDDLPFLFVELEVIDGDAGPELHFTSSTDDRVVADAEHPLVVTENAETGEPRPSLAVRFGMAGRINRNLFYRLVELAQAEPCADGGEELAVYSRGSRFSLGRLC